jgi:signal peptidase II
MRSRIHYLWLTLVVVLLDRGTKAWFESHTDETWRHEVIHNFFYLVHSSNPGIAFSVFANSSSRWLPAMLIVVSLAVVLVLVWMLIAGKSGGAMTLAGLALLIAGATGNVTDRILHGAVTDFIEVWLGAYRWPAFNVADSAITIGAILLVLDAFFGAREQTTAPVTTRKRA